MDTGQLTTSGMSYQDGYRLLVERSPAPVWITYEGRIVFINAAGVKFLGAEGPEQIVGRPPFDFIHPRYHEDVSDRIRRVTSGEQVDVGVLEEEFIRLDGTVVAVSVTAAVFPYRGGTAVQVHFTDLTALRRSEQVAVATERHFRTLVDSVVDYAIFSINTNGVITSWNAGAERIKGYTESEIVGNPYSTFFRPEDIAAGMPQEILRAATEKGHYSGEGWRLRKDGSHFWASVSMAAVRAHDGALQGFSKVTRDLTERHRTEETLQRSEQRFRATFEQAAVGIAHVGLNGAWLRVNDRLCEIVGYTREELSGLTFRDISHPEDVHADSAQAEALLRGDVGTYSMEKRYIRKDGSSVWINLTRSLVRDATGTPEYFIAVAEDVTERKRTEAELLTSENRFRTLFDASPVANYLLDPSDESVVAANQRAAAQLGYTTEELMAMHVADFDVGLSTLDLEGIRRRVSTGASLSFETAHRTKSGEVRDVFVTSEPVVIGGRTLLYASAADITDRKKAEREVRELAATLERRVEDRTRELQEQRLFLQTVLDTIDVAVVSCDGAGKLTLFNRASSDWHALPLAPLPPQQWSEYYSLFEPDGRTPLSTERIPLYRALQGEHIRDVEMVLAPSLGKVRIVRSSGEPLITPDGERLGAVVAMHDVTQQKHAEEERERALARLQDTNQELEAFSYSVSHDLRAPLRSIEGFGKILLRDYEGKLDETAAGHIRRINAATQRMGRLIDDLLMLSRISRQEFKRSVVDVSALTETVLRELQEREPERRVALHVRPGLRTFAGPRLAQVLLQNLLANAWKFTSQTAEPSIEVDALGNEHPTVFLVRDNGAGFDMAFADKLFRPFQRLHQAHEFEGTGIGLATVRRVVIRHGGRIWAEARPDGGATFFFTLEPVDP